MEIYAEASRVFEAWVAPYCSKRSFAIFIQSTMALTGLSHDHGRKRGRVCLRFCVYENVAMAPCYALRPWPTDVQVSRAFSKKKRDLLTSLVARRYYTRRSMGARVSKVAMLVLSIKSYALSEKEVPVRFTQKNRSACSFREKLSYVL